MIFTVKSNTFGFRELIIFVIVFIPQSLQVLKIVQGLGGFLFYENYGVVYSDVRVSLVIPEYFKISFSKVDSHHFDVF